MTDDILIHPVILSVLNRGDTKKVAVYSPAELYSKKKGVCVDLARFGVETLRKIFPESHPRFQVRQ